MILVHISDAIPSQRKILNMVIPFLMCFCSLISNLSVASRIKLQVIPKKCNIIKDVKLLLIIFINIPEGTMLNTYDKYGRNISDILSQIFDVIQSDLKDILEKLN